MPIKLKKETRAQAPPKPGKSQGGKRGGVKYWLVTYGCTLNQSDSLAMKAVLSQNGCAEAASEKDADVIIINSCTVKEATENKIAYQLRRYSGMKKPIVLAGCMSVNEGLIFRNAPRASIVGTSAVGRIYDAVESALAHSKEIFTGFSPKDALPHERKGPIAKIAIAEGCLSACTFCQTRLARGKLYSYPIDSVVLEAKRWLEQGAIELQLTGQDTGAYGAEIRTNVAKLLEAVCAIDGDFKVRLGMANPEHVAKHLPEILKAFENPKMYKFMHLPVQAGSNRVLKAMKRDYTVEGFEALVKALRAKYPGMSIATDIIVGFPTETEEEFEETLALLRRVRFDVVNVSKFSPRPFTKAKEMRQVPKDAIKRRAEICSALCHEITFSINSGFVGAKAGMVVTERQRTMTGRDGNYRTIALPAGSPARIGDRLDVLVTEARATCLIGRPVGAGKPKK